MYAGILRVHDVSRCAPLREILKDPVTDPKKIAAPLPTKKHRCLLISVRQRCFTQPACGCSFFCEALLFKCRNNRAVSAPALQSKAPSRLAKAFQFFKASAFVPDVICQGTPAKKRDKEKGQRKWRKKSAKQVKVPISAEFEQKDVMLHLFSQGCP